MTTSPFSLTGLAQAIHEKTGVTGKQLTQDTLVAAAALAYAFDKKEAGDYFTARAKSYGEVVPGPYNSAHYEDKHSAIALLPKHKAMFGETS